MSTLCTVSGNILDIGLSAIPGAYGILRPLREGVGQRVVDDLVITTRKEIAIGEDGSVTFTAVNGDYMLDVMSPTVFASVRIGVPDFPTASLAKIAFASAPRPATELYPGTRRTQFVAAVAAGWAPENGYVVNVDGLSYRRQIEATAIPDLPGWVPIGDVASFRHFTSTFSGDMTATFEAALRWIENPSGQTTLDGENIQIQLSRTVRFRGFRLRTLRRFHFRCHANWVSAWPGLNGSIWGNPLAIPVGANYRETPFLRIPLGAGGVTIEDCFFDGRKGNQIPGGMPAADFILDEAGSNNIFRNRGRGCANYGYWATNGSAKFVAQNRFAGWEFGQFQRGDPAYRTAALFVCSTGDVEFRENVGTGGGHFSNVNIDNSSVYIGNHWVGGADFNAGHVSPGRRFYCVWEAGGRAKRNADYFDNGVCLISGLARPHHNDLKWISNGTQSGSDNALYEFMPVGERQSLNGLKITGASAIAKTPSGETIVPLPSARFFLLNETYGRYRYHDFHSAQVSGNFTFRGKDAGNPIPALRGETYLLVASTEWGVSGDFFTRTVDLRPYLFLPTVFSYRPTVQSVDPGAHGSTARSYWLRKTLVEGVYTLFSTSGANNELVIRWNSENARQVGSSTYFGPDEPGDVNLSFLFEGGKTGFWLDSRFGLWQDVAKTIPATTAGHLVAAWEGRMFGLTFEQATEGLRPVLGFDEFGNPYLDFAGGKWLQATVDLSGTGRIGVYAALQKATNSGALTVMNQNGTGSPGWRMQVPSSTGGGYGFTAYGGTAQAATSANQSTVPQKVGLIGTADLPGDVVTLRTSVTSGVITTSGDLGAIHSFNNLPVRIGQRTTGANAFEGRVYQAAIVTDVPTDAQAITAMRMLKNAFTNPNGPDEPDDPDGPVVSPLDIWDTQNLVASQAIRAAAPATVALGTGINHIIEYGQSLSVGAEGWPALTKSLPAELDAYMLGDAVRPSTGQDDTFVPVGDPVLRPLKAVVQNTGYSRVLTDAEVAALPVGAGNFGETVSVSATAILKTEDLAKLGVTRDETRWLVASNAGHGGKSIAELSPGGSVPDRWLRFPAVATSVKALATAIGRNYRVAAVLWLQGEADGETSFADYRQRLIDLRAAVNTQVATGIAGQAAMPLFFTYQTNSPNQQALAQLDLAVSNLGFVMVGPIYQVTDKPGAHLDANGYRWVGCQFGKVLARVLVYGEGWQPLRPLQARRLGRRIRVGYHVPVPPLQWRNPYRVLAAHTPPDRGFVVKRTDGTVLPIQSVEIVANTIVEINLVTDPGEHVIVDYAHDPVNARSGMLFDSDPTIAPFTYEYDETTGHYPEANIAELAGRPYPLNNACVAFEITTVNDV